MRQRQSIRARLTLLAATAVTAIALLVCALVWLALSQILLHEADQGLRAIVRGPIRQFAPVDIAKIPSTPLAGATGFRIQVLLADGHIVSAPPGTARLPFSAADRAVAAGRATEASYSVSTPRGRFRVLTVRGKQGETIQLARSLSDTDATLRRVGILMIALVLGAAAVAALAGRLVANAGLRPVNRLTRAAIQIAGTQDLRHPIPADGHDEVAQLGRAFNSMLTALGSSRQAQQELIEDAAHELRTPMSSMRTNIELLVHAGERLDPADRDALLADLDRQSTELSDLVADLVGLARSAGSGEPAVPIDLTEVVANAIRRATARTPHARFRLHSAAFLGQPGTVVAQAAAVERAVVNLLDNAVKFGPDGQVVVVRLAPAGEAGASHAEISVADRGPGIPVAERERVFHRFHRLDDARAVPGSGLGLAIVHQTAAAHGGNVTVEPRQGGGSIFRLRLPVIPCQSGGHTAQGHNHYSERDALRGGSWGVVPPGQYGGALP